MIAVFSDLTDELQEMFEHSYVLATEEHDPKSIEFALIRSTTKVDLAFLNTYSQLKMIVTATSGFDHIDLSACEQKGITVCHTPLAAVPSVSELALAMALFCLRNQPKIPAALATGGFRKALPRGRTLQGKTWGVIGLGRIGSRVAQLVKAFDCEVLAHDPFLNAYEFQKHAVSSVSLDNLLRESDIVTLHVPLTEQTEKMMAADSLKMMKKDAVLINTSRGAVVCESSLLQELKDSPQKMAGLDVFENEPLLRDSPIIDHPQIVVTPHIGAYCDDVFFAATSQAIESIHSFMRGEAPPHVLRA